MRSTTILYPKASFPMLSSANKSFTNVLMKKLKKICDQSFTYIQRFCSRTIRWFYTLKQPLTMQVRGLNTSRIIPWKMIYVNPTSPLRDFVREWFYTLLFNNFDNKRLNIFVFDDFVCERFNIFVFNDFVRERFAACVYNDSIQFFTNGWIYQSGFQNSKNKSFTNDRIQNSMIRFTNDSILKNVSTWWKIYRIFICEGREMGPD